MHGFRAIRPVLWSGFVLLALLAGCNGGGSTPPFLPTGTAAVPIATTVPIMAAQGGTVSLPDGTSVTIPAGLLSADANVTLSSSPKTAPPPDGSVAPVSSDVTLSFASQLPSAKGRSIRLLPRDNAVGNIKVSIKVAAANLRAVLDSGLMQVKLHVPDVGFHFISPDITVDSVSNLVLSSIPSLEFTGTDHVVFTVLTFASQYQSMPATTNFLNAADQWTPPPSVIPSGKRTLIMIHGIGSTVPDTFASVCAAKYKHNGGYEQVLGYSYDWSRPPKEAGAAFVRFVNGLDESWIDIQAHSYGTIVTLQALPDIKAPVKNVILIAGPLPLNGLPQAGDGQFSNFLRALVLNGITHDMPQAFAAVNSGMVDSVRTGSRDLRDIVSRLPQGQSSPRYIEVAGTDPSPFDTWGRQLAFHKPYDGLIETRSAESGDINPSGVALGKFRRNEFPFNHKMIVCADPTINFVKTSIDTPAPASTGTPTPPGPTPTPPGPTPTPPGPTPTPPGPTPTPPGPTPTPPPPSTATTSRYMSTIDSTVLYNEGCSMGRAGLSGVVILDFGKPWFQNGTYGTRMFGANTPFASLAQITAGAEGYLDGYFNCSLSGTSELRLAVGTDNSQDSNGNFANANHGAAWGQMVASIDAFIAGRGYGLHQFIRGAIDIRPQYNTYTATKAWVEAFHAATNAPLYNYGTADGCNSSGTCDNGWTSAGVWYVSNADFGSYPIPQVVNNLSVEQWYQVSAYAAVNQGGKLRFLGTMTASSVFPNSFTPAQGFQALQTRINSDPRTAYPLQYSTDITFTN